MNSEHGPSPEEINQAELSEIEARLQQLDMDLIAAAAANDMIQQIRITQEATKLLQRRALLSGEKPDWSPRGIT